MVLAPVRPVDWPKTPVERLQAFRPPFCPRPDCPEHHRRDGQFRFRLKGTYPTRRSEHNQRFLCVRGDHTFSERAFSPRYFLKRPELLVPAAAGLVAGSAHRQIARSLGCSPSTVTRLSARIGRHALLLMARALERLRGRLAEPIGFDHFESFEFAQDYPFGIATPVGSVSWFVYGADPAPHARTGRRSPAQAQRLRRRPGRPRRGGYTGSTTRMLDSLLPLTAPGDRLHLLSDDKPQYRQAVDRHPAAEKIRLVQYANPPRGPKGAPRSPQARERDRQMFAVDAWHALIRHSAAHHRRESLAFGRRLNALIERTFLLMVWRNFVKQRSERKPDGTTPAMWVALTGERWSWKRVFARRLFLRREKVPDPWRQLYRRDWISPMLPANTRHRLVFAE
jgi:transposase-like protein